MNEDVEGLETAQARMITGALSMYQAQVEGIMTEVKKIQSLSIETVMNKRNLLRIRNIGFSRIPLIMSDENPLIVGILMAKSLIGLEPSDTTLRDLCITD